MITYCHGFSLVRFREISTSMSVQIENEIRVLVSDLFWLFQFNLWSNHNVMQSLFVNSAKFMVPTDWHLISKMIKLIDASEVNWKSIELARRASIERLKDFIVLWFITRRNEIADYIKWRRAIKWIRITT